MGSALGMAFRADRKSTDMLLGYKINHNHASADVKDVEQTMKSVLQHAVAMRLEHPGQEKIEKHCAQKGAIESAKGRTIDIIITEKDYPTRSKVCGGLDVVAEEPEYDDAYSDGISYDSRS
ncbi:hypothetical protein BPOR_0002g00360 [Botrytis porri]|uniref:Uncharacterized protein n=1 Tax=Botrytis porri TaxID=87229 RepID=A0A4Z1L6Q3_9HELO|nr:hypothetical protein BPOR_0002g00360 [Botrytis porri]